MCTIFFLRGRPAGSPLCSFLCVCVCAFVFVCVCVKFRGLPRVTTASCFSRVAGTSHQLQVSAATTFSAFPFFSSSFWLTRLASYSALKHHPPLSLVQTCKVLFFFFTGKCHLFQETLLFQAQFRVRRLPHCCCKRWLWVTGVHVANYIWDCLLHGVTVKTSPPTLPPRPPCVYHTQMSDCIVLHSRLENLLSVLMHSNLVVDGRKFQWIFNYLKKNLCFFHGHLLFPADWIIQGSTCPCWCLYPLSLIPPSSPPLTSRPDVHL